MRITVCRIIMSGPIAKPVLRNLWISQAKKDLAVGLGISVVAGLATWFGWALPKRKKIAAFDQYVYRKLIYKINLCYKQFY